MRLKLALLVPVLGLAGCAAGSYCEGQQDYQRARSVPAVKPAEGLKVPDSGRALRIPPAPARAVPYGEVVKDEDGDAVVRCLDKPPELPPLAPEPEPKAAEKPAA
jgi:uncharacterized lipoprotein